MAGIWAVEGLTASHVRYPIRFKGLGLGFRLRTKGLEYEEPRTTLNMIL